MGRGCNNYNIPVRARGHDRVNMQIKAAHESQFGPPSKVQKVWDNFAAVGAKSPNKFNPGVFGRYGVGARLAGIGGLGFLGGLFGFGR